MQNELINYSIIIPAYNEEKYLPKTLKSVQKAMNANPEYQGEIILVDNDSQDKTADIAITFGANVIHEKIHNIGKVRNTGAKAAKGDWLIFLDADTVLMPETLTITLNTLLNSDIIGGTFLLKPDRKINLITHIIFFVWNNYSRLFNRTIGAYVFCKKSAFEAMGGFDEEYFAAEDIIFSRALDKYAKKNNKKFVVIPKYIVFNTRKMDIFPIGFKMLFELIAGLINQKRYKNPKNCKYWY